ncbi:MAG: hypothetical protein R3B45_16755 [Bdellovibrionota bacterium]
MPRIFLYALIFLLCNCKNNSSKVASTDSNALSFTEQMTGYWSQDQKYKQKELNDLEDKELLDAYDAAYLEGKKSKEKNDFTFSLTIETNVKELKSDETRPGKISEARTDTYGKETGYFNIPLISDKHLALDGDGIFNLLAQDTDNKKIRKMRYKVKLKDPNSNSGKSYYFYGYKLVEQDKRYVNALEIWRDTSTLYATLYKGDKNLKIENFDPTNINSKKFEFIGRGILHIKPQDFARQITTIRSTILNLLGFTGYFADSLIQTYIKPAKDVPLNGGRIVHDDTFSLYEEKYYGQRYGFLTEDGLSLGLVRYINKEKHEKKKSSEKFPLLLIAGLGVNNRIFTQTTTKVNLVSYLVDNGFDVWLIETRFNTDYPRYAKSTSWNGDDVSKDYKAAIEKILLNTGSSKVNIFAHCYGSSTFLNAFMTNFGGDNKGIKIRKAINAFMASQATLFMDVPKLKLTQVNTIGKMLPTMEKTGVRYLTTDDSDDPWSSFSTDQNSAFAQLNDWNEKGHRSHLLRGLLDLGHDKMSHAFNLLTANIANGLGYGGRDLIIGNKPINCPDGHHVRLSNDAYNANQRIRFIYGELHDLCNLSQEALSQFSSWYGPASMEHLIHLQKSVSEKKLTNFNETALFENKGKAELLTRIPFHIIHSENNQTWLLSSSTKTIKYLHEEFPANKDNVVLHTIPGYGHLDSIYGENAYNVTYPVIGKFFSQFGGKTVNQ